jgi:hypothetical protein
MSRKKPRWYSPIADIILGEYPDVVLLDTLFNSMRGTCLLLTPVRHYFRYLLLARRGNNQHFEFGHEVTPLYKSINDFSQPYYDRVLDPAVRHIGTFIVDNPELPDVVRRSVPNVVTFLRAVEEPKSFMNYVENHTMSICRYDLGQAWAYAAAGDFALSATMVALQIERFTWNTTLDDPRLQMEDFQGLLRLDAALKEGKDAVLAVLRENERRNVEKFKLEQYWQPTPFPFE